MDLVLILNKILYKRLTLHIRSTSHSIVQILVLDKHQNAVRPCSPYQFLTSGYWLLLDCKVIEGLKCPPRSLAGPRSLVSTKVKCKCPRSVSNTCVLSFATNLPLNISQAERCELSNCTANDIGGKGMLHTPVL